MALIVDLIGGAEGDRTPDLMTASAVGSSASGHGSYDSLTFVTGCSRQRVYLLPPIQASFDVVLSQVCRNTSARRFTTFRTGHLTKVLRIE